MEKDMKIHKPGCLANTKCLVIHSDGVCGGPYGKCTCETTTETKKNLSHLRPRSGYSLDHIKGRPSLEDIADENTEAINRVIDYLETL